MPKISYVAGRYLPHPYALTHINDRGYQFADAAYEVVTYVKGVPLDIEGHLARLRRTLSFLKIDNFKMTDRALELVMETLIEKNRLESCLLYLQLSRGIAPRNHFSPKDARPILTMSCSHLNLDKLKEKMSKALRVKTMPDLRHARCDLKTVSLLPNVLAMDEAKASGFDDALFIDNDGHITEGASWNFWIVTKDNKLKTRFLDEHILHGITRHTVLKCAKEMGLEVVEAAVSLDDIRNASEAFATSASKFCMPIKQIDDIQLPESYSMTEKLRHAYMNHFGLKGL